MRDVGEARTIEDLRDALGSSLDLRKALEAARPLLLRAVPADYLAVGVTKADRLEELDWFASEMPAGFLDTYDEMAPHDFVLHSVVRAPNRVLRDSDMIERRELESNVMYGRARDLGMPIEHVMSTLFYAGDH